jgi:hypothetical protein
MTLTISYKTKLVGTELVEVPTYLADGREVSKRKFDSLVQRSEGCPMASKAWQRPLVSNAAGVHRKQRQEAIEHVRSKGVPTDFTADGRPVFTSRAHRKAYLKTRRNEAGHVMVDHDGGYGD